MEKEQYHITIIGGGISGLIAARVLEDHGYSPLLIEATDRVGGRVKTDIIEGYQLDHGFQVLLTAYPAAQHYLDLEALKLQYFVPGATVFTNGQPKTLGDPLRDFSLLFSTLFSGIGTFSDKLRILKLNMLLKKSTLAEIFAKPEKTTFQYLIDFGFTESMISKFFKPFFCGIFLESELETSSRMFEFVYKMFGEGLAALPKDGIEAIPKQLKNTLKRTAFRFNTKVQSIEDGNIVLTDGTQLESHFTIIATEASGLVTSEKVQKIKWKSCDTLYFETPNRLIKKPLIGLVAHKDALINNIFYHTSLDMSTTGGKELLSVTIVKDHGLTGEVLKKEVEQELQRYCGENTYRFIKHYEIAKALPKLADLKYNMSPSETRLSKRIFLAGDIHLNGSLNAAMLSGESAALAVIEALSNENAS